MARRTLSTWIRECLTNEDEKVSAFALVHITGATAEKEIFSIRIGGKKYEPDELATIFENKVDDDCEGLPNVQQYFVLAFFGKGKTSSQRYPIRKVGESSLEGVGSEPPTPQGLLAQQMRLTEGAFRMLTSGLRDVVELQNETIRALAADNAELRKNELEYVGMAKRLVMDTREHESKLRVFEMMKIVGIEAAGDLARALPALVNTMSGKELFPSSTADESVIDLLLDKISEEQIGMLAGVLPPEVLALLAPRLLKAAERKQKKDAAKKRTQGQDTKKPAN